MAMINDRPDFKGHAATLREAAGHLCAKCGRAVLKGGTSSFSDCDDDCPALELLRIADDIEQSSEASKQGVEPGRIRPRLSVIR